MAHRFYVLECRAVGCVADVYLNDVPIIRRGTDTGAQYGGQRNQFVRDGWNELTIVVHPGPSPSEALPGPGLRRRRRPADDPSPGRPETIGEPRANAPAEPEGDGYETVATAALAGYPYGAVFGGDDRTPLTEVRWSGRPGKVQWFPRVVTRRVDLGPVFGAWAWESAPRVDAALEAERPAIVDLLRRLHGALHRGDPGPFVEATRLRFEETARAYAGDAARLEAECREMMADEAAKPGYGMQPFDEDALDLRACGEGRLVECLARDGKAFLRERPRGAAGTSYYPMWLAKVAGRWEVVR